MAPYSYLLFPFAVFLSLLLPSPSHCGDPSPLQDFCVADVNSTIFINGFPCKNPATVTADDFLYSGFKQSPSGFDSYGSNVTLVTAREYPGINTLGVSINRITILPGGNTQYRTHPRGTLLVLLLEGEMTFGFFATDNSLYLKTLSAGDLFVVPVALLHFGINIGEVNAVWYAALDGQDPGGQLIGPLDLSLYARIKSEFPTIKLPPTKLASS